MSVDIDSIRRAADTLAGEAVRTPTVRCGALSDALGCDLHLKLETLQRTGSFKDRGALVKLKGLTPEEAARGVIAISAGNHAQGVAYHAKRLGIPATIVMPEGTPFNKITRTKAFGARVLLHGDNLSAANPYADEIAGREGLTFVHPYDDPAIIAGQGTVGLELLSDLPHVDAVVVPIGGGGLISGIATAVKALAPRVEVIGVESALYPSMYQAIHGLAPTAGGVSIAEGIAVKTPGTLTRPIVETLVEDILLVDEAAIESAIEAMIDSARLLAEGAGATPLAAVQAHPDRFAGRRVALIVAGGNIDQRLLASVLLRGMVRGGELARLRVTITDQPGVLSRVAAAIGDTGGNIVEIYHQRMFFDLPVMMADVDIVVETRDETHIREIVTRLQAAGFKARRLHDSEASG